MNSVMLDEHFRSLPPIIEFSNREFYNGKIRIMRKDFEKTELKVEAVSAGITLIGGTATIMKADAAAGKGSPHLPSLFSSTKAVPRCSILRKWGSDVRIGCFLEISMF